MGRLRTRIERLSAKVAPHVGCLDDAIREINEPGSTGHRVIDWGPLDAEIARINAEARENEEQYAVQRP